MEMEYYAIMECGRMDSGNMEAICCFEYSNVKQLGGLE